MVQIFWVLQDTWTCGKLEDSYDMGSWTLGAYMLVYVCIGTHCVGTSICYKLDGWILGFVVSWRIPMI